MTDSQTSTGQDSSKADAIPPVVDADGDHHGATLAAKKRSISDTNDEDMDGDAWRSEAVHSPSLTKIASKNWPRISITYTLFVLENLVRMSEPFFLGLAVDGLIGGTSGGLLVFMGQYAARILIGAFRHRYDTRTFTGIYAELAASLVRQQRSAGVPVSFIAARTALSRELTVFFERDIPILVYTLFNIVGSIVMIGWYDRISMVVCLSLCVPVWFASRAHAIRTSELNRQLNDEYEQQVQTIAQGSVADIDRHFEAQRRLQVRISDSEAIGFTFHHSLLLVVMTLCLISACRAAPDPGRLLALFQYLTLLAASFTQLPFLIQQLTRLRDILRRMNSQAEDCQLAVPASNNSRCSDWSA